MTDAKIAKLNNATKRPILVKNWEDNMPKEVVSVATPVVRDYGSLLDNVGITAVNYAPIANNSGAKKLRVNKIVNEKASKIYGSVSKVDVIAEKQEMPVPQVEEKPQININNSLEPNVVNTREDVHGRHEHTGEIPVDAIKEAVNSDVSVVNNNPPISRMERNAMVNEVRNDSKAGDMDLYNNLLHNVGQEDDVSKQLQGARNQLSIEKAESRKLAEQYGEAVKELEKLKEDIETTKKVKEQQVKQELSNTLKDIETLQKENLERTSDLTSIQSEIARLKAEKRAMEENVYEESRSFGRAA